MTNKIQWIKLAYAAEGMQDSISHAPSSIRLLSRKTHQTQLFLIQMTQTADKVTK